MNSYAQLFGNTLMCAVVKQKGWKKGQSRGRFFSCHVGAANSLQSFGSKSRLKTLAQIITEVSISCFHRGLESLKNFWTCEEVHVLPWFYWQQAHQDCPRHEPASQEWDWSGKLLLSCPLFQYKWGQPCLPQQLRNQWQKYKKTIHWLTTLNPSWNRARRDIITLLTYSTLHST